MKESAIEAKVCAYARNRYNMLTPKFVSPNNAGMPDRIFITEEGIIAFVEFKAEGEGPTPHQCRQLDKLVSHRCDVFVVDSVEKGIKLVDAMSDTATYQAVLYGHSPALGEKPRAPIFVPSHVSEARRGALMEEPEGDAVAGHGPGQDGNHPVKPH